MAVRVHFLVALLLAWTSAEADKYWWRGTNAFVPASDSNHVQELKSHISTGRQPTTPDCSCIKPEYCNDVPRSSAPCGDRHSKYVCCTQLKSSQPNHPDESDFDLGKATGRGKFVQPSKEECGISTNHYGEDEKSSDSTIQDASRIDSFENEFPWTVQIMEGDRALCSGALIKTNFVITAAHCVRNNSDHSSKDPKSLVVWSGVWDFSEEHPKYPHRNITVKKVIIHPGYKSSGQHSDVALLLLKDELDIVTFPNIRKLCFKDKANIIRGECYATGWGARDEVVGGRNQDKMKRVKVELMNGNACEAALKTTNLGGNFKLSNSSLCGKGAEGADTELGDGGGPLFCKEKLKAGNKMKPFILVGITSWGVANYPNKPGVYASYRKVHKWVQKAIMEEIENEEGDGEDEEDNEV